VLWQENCTGRAENYIYREYRERNEFETSAGRWTAVSIIRVQVSGRNRKTQDKETKTGLKKNE